MYHLMGIYATIKHNYLHFLLKYFSGIVFMSSLPNFTQSLTQLIACPSISSTQASWDQGNLEVIQLTWYVV